MMKVKTFPGSEIDDDIENNPVFRPVLSKPGSFMCSKDKAVAGAEGKNYNYT
jgi:hypothetical protein